MDVFLKDIDVDNDVVREALAKNHITLDILKTMDSVSLKGIGIISYGVRHKLLKEVKKRKG